MTEAPDSAGVVIRPPILFLLTLALAVALDWLVPLPVPTAGTAARVALAVALAGTGAFVVALAAAQFRRAGTNVPTWMPTRALVADGLYGWSRNPIYVGLILLYLGLAAAAASAWAIVLLPAAWAVLRWGVIAREERYLERKFGDAYRGYRATVRRWL